MKRFLERVQVISSDIDRQKEAVDKIDQLTRRVSGATNEKESKELIDNLQNLREDFLEDMGEVKEQISAIQKQAKDPNISSHERHIRQQHTNSLIERTKKLIETFSTAQTEFGHEERSRIKSQYIIARPAATKEEIDAVAYGEEEKASFSITDSKHAETKHRKQSLQKIFQGIQELSQMTDQLNLLVDTTEKDVDKVAVATTVAETKAKKADKDLKKALTYQRLARFAKLMVLSLVIILIIGFIIAMIGGVLFLIIMTARNMSSSNPSPPTDGSSSTPTTPTNSITDSLPSLPSLPSFPSLSPNSPADTPPSTDPNPPTTT
ncbi:hypothetical protein NEHOM01_0603 [Nematocida homosporus]|uniref:uncharacterized protein n=1 Tax=Nematocida homosporus TaxID=1912981 RepID=UPI00221EA6A9|nr:uncharacterized protein NEHOM01_0603 [Nematocida homosporus]KAI5185098.1 hypothetical protein NEHOM01_0603 [Nematocida homosporus]